MKLKTYIPSAQLRPYIKKYLIIESQDALVNNVFPDTSLVMVFRFKGDVSTSAENGVNRSLPLTAVTGMRKTGRHINYSADTANILVLFNEGGAGAFIKEPLYDIFGTNESLDHFENYHDSHLLNEQLAETKSDPQKIRLVEQYLQSKLLAYNQDMLVKAAIKKIHDTKGIIRIKDLASSLCISVDPFEKRFKRSMGISPKQFSYIVKMRSVVSTSLEQQTLSDLAFNAGYFDQPHFNKDFKQFTGQTPTEFFKSPVFW